MSVLLTDEPQTASGQATKENEKEFSRKVEVCEFDRNDFTSSSIDPLESDGRPSVTTS